MAYKQFFYFAKRRNFSMELNNNKNAEDNSTVLPKINVIIPVYNGEHTILKTLESVFSQNYDNFRVICIGEC